MATSADARLTLHTEKGNRSLISIREQQDNLMLILKTGDIFYGIEAPNKFILEHRYSIHTSDDSKENINLIKQTIRISGGQIINTYQRTSALKQHDRFAFLFAARAQDISLARYISKNPSRTNMSLGRLETGRFNLVFGVYVSRSGRRFNRLVFADISIHQIEFARFNLVILSSYFPLPSHHSGFFMHSITEFQDSQFGETSVGGDELECLNEFVYCRESLRKEFLEDLSKDGVSAEHLWMGSRWFKSGDVDASDYNAYLSAFVRLRRR